MSQNTPLLHSIKAAAVRAGVSESSIWRLRRKGKLRTVKVLGRTMVPESELQRLAQPTDGATYGSMTPPAGDIGASDQEPDENGGATMPMVRGSHKYL